MLWAPHNGIGYPFSVHGPYQAAPGSPDFAALDTNGDGVLTAQDDMYHPYYPGDDVVDWVGMTLYHWGVTYPWLENEMPPPNSFASTLRGAGHEPPIPDFYARYCADAIHHKPLAIPETAALFNPQQPPGPGEFPLKQAWWRQVFNASEANTNDANIAVDFSMKHQDGRLNFCCLTSRRTCVDNFRSASDKGASEELIGRTVKFGL